MALTMAVAVGKAESVRLLIEHGADPNLADMPDGIGLYPLQYIFYPDDQDVIDTIVRTLVKGGADVNGGRRGSPLMSTKTASVDTVKFLIDSGADVNALKPNGTPLHRAIENNRPDIVELLLKHGADPNVRAIEDPKLTPLELAQKLKRKKIIEILQKTTGKATGAPASKSWPDIKEELRKEFPAYYKSLRKGASKKETQKLAKTLGVVLPDSLQALLQSNDGQKEGSDGMIRLDDEEYCFLPVEQIEADWKTLKGLVDAGEFKGQKGNSDKEVRKDWWNPGWVPFAGNGAGDYVCVDTVPTASGKVGQVISTSHESARRVQLASSLDEFLSEQLEKLRETSGK
jgi:cell wall assembly regulator SMI1